MSGEPKHVYTTKLPEPIPVERSKYWHLFTGGVAGGVSRTVTAPLERLKILRQCATPEYEGISFYRAMIKFYSLEGFRGFFKGNGSNVAKIVPFSAVEFFAFEMAKHHIMPKDNPRHKGWLLFSGSLAGVIASILTYPMDLVRTILAIHTDKAKHGMIEELVKVYRTGGIFGLYRGLGMTLVGISPFIGIKMATFDVLKAKYLPNPESPKFTLMNLVLGGIAGTFSMFLTYPTDLLRRKIQLLAFESTGNAPYTGIASCCQYLYKTEGYRGFYRGMFPSFLKVAPSMAVVFAVNEKLKQLIGIK